MRYENIADHKHTLKVIKWEDGFQCHNCKTADGSSVLVDLFVSGDFGENVQPKDLIGKTVEIGWSNGFIWIAHEVALKESE